MARVDLLRQLDAARAFQPQGFVRFTVGASPAGRIRRDLADLLRRWPDVFEHGDDGIRLSDALGDERTRTQALARVARALADDGAIRGWRSETYSVAGDHGAPLFHIERAAARFFGLLTAGAHANGYVGAGAGLRMFVARRAATKSIDPGMLDNLVAGGVPSGQDPWQALLRECDEEAGIPRPLAATARAAGVLRICHEVPEGLHHELLHAHDLALPADFAPRNADGEVSEFTALDMPAVLGAIGRGEMTVDASLVAVDFALRHGLLHDDAVAAAVEACRVSRPGDATPSGA
jgi:8-oxo-dGTP pyrophosphatase MutT (NUDIX family)